MTSYCAETTVRDKYGLEMTFHICGGVTRVQALRNLQAEVISGNEYINGDITIYSECEFSKWVKNNV